MDSKSKYQADHERQIEEELLQIDAHETRKRLGRLKGYFVQRTESIFILDKVREKLRLEYGLKTRFYDNEWILDGIVMMEGQGATCE